MLQNFLSEICPVRRTIFRSSNAFNASFFFNKHLFVSSRYVNNWHSGVFRHVSWHSSAETGFPSPSIMSLFPLFEPRTNPILRTTFSKQWPQMKHRWILFYLLYVTLRLIMKYYLRVSRYCHLYSCYMPPSRCLLYRQIPFQQ